MKTTFLAIVAALLSASVADASGAVELTQLNFKDTVHGKNAIVKFLAPWPDWDRLGEEYAASSSVVIGDADCTESGEALCTQYQVRGYPTIKYFVDGDLKGEDYSGGRDYASLKKFVEDKLEVKCDVKDPSECTDKERKYITKMEAKTSAERVSQIERLEKMSGDKMKADLKQWLHQRLHILRSLEA